MYEKVKMTIMNDGLSRNGRKFDLEVLEKTFREYIEQLISEEDIFNHVTNMISGFKPGQYILIGDSFEQELMENEYRKFIEENRFKRVKYIDRQISIPRVKCAQSNRNNFKHASRRFLNGLGK